MSNIAVLDDETLFISRLKVKHFALYEDAIYIVICLPLVQDSERMIKLLQQRHKSIHDVDRSTINKPATVF